MPLFLWNVRSDLLIGKVRSEPQDGCAGCVLTPLADGEDRVVKCAVKGLSVLIKGKDVAGNHLSLHTDFCC